MKLLDVSAESLPLCVEECVDAACCRFESAWQEGGRPCLESYLTEVNEPGSGVLLRELLRLEVYYRARSGEVPSADEYRVRFPDSGEVVDSVLVPVFST